MTEREYLKNEVLVRLGDKINSFGFKLSKSACEFTKKTDFGWNKYQIVFLLRDDGWELKPSLLVRFNVVENLFHQISDFDKKYQKGTPTIGTSIEDLDNSSMASKKIGLTNETQINSIVKDLFDLFKNSAIPFFNKYDNLSEIDNKLNSCLEDTSLTGGIFKGTKSLITAKLTKREDFDKLESVYQSYYENFSDGFYLPEYLRLKELLKT
ncbi:hypothetical protein ACYSNX_12930 [Myroides sp. LJL115]